MKALPRLVFWFGLGAALLSPAAAREKWLQARTEHFEMFSSASEDESRELLANLEQFRATVLSIYSLPRLHDPRTTVVVFGSDRQFDPYKPLYNGKRNDVAGYCIGSPDETVIALAADQPFEDTGEIVFHEYTHLLMAAGDEQPPLWLNEGLAEFFSTFAVEKGSFELGRAKHDHVDTLNRYHLMPLGWLFAVTTQSPSYNEGIRQNLFYAESWALVHFLVCGKDRATYLPKLRRFSELLATPGRAIDQSFHDAFGMDYDEMEMNLRRALQGGGYRFQTGPLILGDLSSQIQFRPASDFERDLALLDLRARLQQPGSTTYQLLQLAEQHPAFARPHEVLGAIALREGDWEGGLNHWRRAAELGSDNAYVYVQLAKENLDQVTAGWSPDYRMPAELAERLRGWLDRAVALSPNYLEAYEQLAWVEALAERPRPDVVNRVQAVVPRMRDKTRAQFAVALIHWRIHDFDTTRQITRLLIASPRVSADLRRRARQLDGRIPPPDAPAEPSPAPK